MGKETTSGQKQKQERDTSKSAETSTQKVENISSGEGAPAPVKNVRSNKKGEKPRIGGSAVQGAKSTQPKQITPGNNSNQQQAESYNRDMRRRMQHLGTGPYSENQKAQTAQDQRRKRIERRKQRLEERRQQFRNTLPGGKITLGRRNLYFLLAVAAIIILLIAVFIVIRRPF